MVAKEKQVEKAERWKQARHQGGKARTKAGARTKKAGSRLNLRPKW
jgi:hypothetical protein